jgi:GT2 family glycosyltransferase/exopolysaccharide biosynthesis predicted pyruvyltransferase EpsI
VTLLGQSTVGESRAALLGEIGADADVTLLRGFGNLGDGLIAAGTHALLEGRVYREVSVDELPSSSGDTLLLPGSGAFCRPYHEWMPRALAIAELRFDRVIVLPSSFDPAEDVVRSVLQRSRATVFAREAESLRRISGLCRARLAHDCAFFFDFSGYAAAGEGTLNAFRTDREAADGEILAADNDDISVTAPDLEGWLRTIERHRVVRTDRAHVMIAAALMGKQVEFSDGSYHKLDSLATTWLGDRPVRRVAAPRTPAAPGLEPLAGACTPLLEAAAASAPAGAAGGEVTAVILTRDRIEPVAAAVRSVLAAELAAQVLLIGNNPAPASRAALTALAAGHPRIALRLSDRNLGCAGGRSLAAELVQTELVLFLDDDAELLPGALERLVAELIEHPEAEGVTALVVGPGGVVQHFGGWIGVSSEAATFTREGAGMAFDDPALAPSGPSDWVPGTVALLRTRVLREVPVDARMAAYYEDNEWCLRVHERRPGSFRRCREAIVLHRHRTDAAGVFSSRFARGSMLVERLAAHAVFLRNHGILLGIDLPVLVPELATGGGGLDVPAARLLLELVDARGTDWALAEWMNGGLMPLLRARRDAELRSAYEQSELELAQTRTERALAEQRVASLVEQLEWQSGRSDALGDELAAAKAEHEAGRRELEPHLAWLTAREQTLRRVETGGWWRLRSRLQPLLVLVAAIRTRLSSAR